MSIHETLQDPEKEHRPITRPPKPKDKQLAFPIVVNNPALLSRKQRVSTIWQDLGYASPEAYMDWIRRMSSRDIPLFQSKAPGGHNKSLEPDA